MRILILCPRIPSSDDSVLLFRVLNGVLYLSQKYGHSITLVSFKYNGQSKKHYEDYYDKIVTVELPERHINRLAFYLLDHIIAVCTGKLSLGYIIDFPFSWKLKRKLEELLAKQRFDVIFVSEPSMVSYVAEIDLPKIVEIWAVSKIYYHGFKKRKNVVRKLFLRLLYLRSRTWETKYKNFDLCITPTESERDLMNSFLSHLNISVIPFGINTNSKSEDFEQDFPSLLYFGTMSYSYNQRSILYFYNGIYPLIKEKIPEIKLYIVGKDPSKEILSLARDRSVVVTGYVEHMRPYLARATVITLPISFGYGVKTRILEAMAMGKSVITTSEGIHGIDVTPGKDIIIADDPKEFVRRVIELLSDKELREKIGANARKLMEEEYSWEKMTDKLNHIFRKVINKK